VGFCIGKKFYTFGSPVLNENGGTSWPLEIVPRSRAGFFLDPFKDEGRKFMDSLLLILKGKALWEVARAYAMTECGRTFVSPALGRKSLRLLRAARPQQTSQVAMPVSRTSL
jgi:hypothetical protein